MTEKEALIKLGAKDWLPLNGEQNMSFLFEIAPNLSDEIRLRILESAPDILNTAIFVLDEYQNTARKALEQNQEISKKILDQNHDTKILILAEYRKNLETFRELLSNPSTSDEDKKYWNIELSKCIREMREYEKEKQPV